MSFALDRYEPVALHARPELMRAAEAQTMVLPDGAATAAPIVVPPTPEAPAPVVPPPPPSPPPAPRPEPIAAYVVGLGTTETLRSQLADFLDAAGARRDVRVSVGVADGTGVAWALRDQVPYGVRALPRYPETARPDVGAVLAAVGAAVAGDAAETPDRRRLVVLLWDRVPEPVSAVAGPAGTLVLHCVDAVLPPVSPDGRAPTGWLLARTRPGVRPSLLGHAGRLLDDWAAFAMPPAGLVLDRLPETA